MFFDFESAKKIYAISFTSFLVSAYLSNVKISDVRNDLTGWELEGSNLYFNYANETKAEFASVIYLLLFKLVRTSIK